MKVISAICCVAVLVAAACRGEQAFDYRYETRPTKQAPGFERHRHVAALFGRTTVGLFGGFSVGEVELFDLATETFTKLPDKHHFGDFTGVALANGRVLLVEGRGDCVFDFAIKKFSVLGKQFTDSQVRWAELVPLPDGKVFACGGFDGKFKPLDDCALFDPATHRFEPVGRLVLPRAHHTATLISDHEILITGGCGADRIKCAYDSMEIFDLKTHTSTALPVKLKQTRERHLAALLPDGRVLLAAGSNPQSRMHTVATAELFDPKTRTLAEGGTMIKPTWSPLAATLPSGRIALFGGIDHSRMIEIYCPAENRFIMAGQLMIEPRRSGFTVTPLPDGSILIVGGRIGSGGEELRAAEIFREVRVPTSKVKRPTPEQLVAALLAAKEGEREAVMGKLIAMGPIAEAAVTPLLSNSVVEVRRCAERIVADLAAHESPPWCIQVKNQAGKSKTVWCSDYTAPRKTSELLTTVKEQMQSPEDHLIVHFPLCVPPEKQAELFNAVGLLRTPYVFLGEPLKENP